MSTVSSWGGGGEVWGVYCEFIGWGGGGEVWGFYCEFIGWGGGGEVWMSTGVCSIICVLPLVLGCCITVFNILLYLTLS